MAISSSPCPPNVMISHSDDEDENDDDEDEDEEEDEEFRRAQEMALAVAALGSGGSSSSSSTSSSSMTALDIRMAVADVMCGASSSTTGKNSRPTTPQTVQKQQQQQQVPQEEQDIMKLKKQLYAASKEKHEQEAKNEKLKRHILRQELRQNSIISEQQQQQKQQNFAWYLISSVWNDTMGPYFNPLIDSCSPYLQFVTGKSLEGSNLVFVMIVVNSSIFYLYLTTRSVLSEISTTATTKTNNSLWISFCNVTFIINMTMFLCLTKAGGNAATYNNMQGTTKQQAELKEKKRKARLEKEKRQEQILLATATSRSTAATASAVATSATAAAAAAATAKSGPQLRLEWLDGITFSNHDLQELQKLQPESTLAERRRFLKARKHCVKAASAQLGTYLQWRQDNRVHEFFPSTFTTDRDDWEAAGRGALEICNTTGTHVHQVKLPRLVSIFEENSGSGGDPNQQLVVCKNGARVVHVLPCQLDSTLAPPSTYALAVAMYLDRKLDRNHTEKVTVVIDIRFGTGWTNPSSVSIVPFIKLVVGLLNTYFPERLSRCILFPLPRTATMLFNTAKTYLDPDTAAKIQVCSGAGSIKAAVPEKVYSFIDRDAIQVMEKRRKSFFRPPEA